MVFNIATVCQNDSLFKVRHLTGSHVHRKVVVQKKWREIDTLLLHSTNKKYHIAYLFVPVPMNLDDLEGHSPNASRRTFVRHLARF